MINAAAINAGAINAPSVVDELVIEVAGPIRIRLVVRNPARRWSIPRNRIVQTIYLCELRPPSGSGLDTVRLPITSLQCRIRDGAPTYVSAVIPGYDPDQFQAIVDRLGEPNNKGRLAIMIGVRLADGTEVVEELISANIENPRYDRGPRSASTSLTAYVSRTTTQSQVVDVTGLVSVAMQADGKRRIQCEPSFFLRAGDVARYGNGDGESMIVGLISLSVTPRNATMFLTER